MFRQINLVYRQNTKAFVGATAIAATVCFISCPHLAESFTPLSNTYPLSQTNTFHQSPKWNNDASGASPLNSSRIFGLNRIHHIMATSPISSSHEVKDIITTTLTTKAKQFYKGKTILVTGASGGLGQAFVLHLAQCGASQIIITGRDEISLNQLAQRSVEVISKSINSDNEEDKTLKTSIHSITCDLSDLNAVENLGKKALDISPEGIDILINNGGISSRSPFIETEIEVDELLMRVNYLAGACLAKFVTPGMIKKGEGAIIWISSVQGLVGIPNRTSYAASKFAVQGYCEALRAELASSGVSVHVVSPGYIRTNLSRSAIQGNGSLYGKMDKTTANGANPIEVAADILNGVSEGKSDLIVAATFSARVAIWLRFFAPSLLKKLLVKRFDKSSSN